MGWIATVACLVVASGCGRVGFAPVDDTAADARSASADDDAATPVETITVPAVADTALNSIAPTLNYGGATTFNVRSDAVSTYTALLRFELPNLTGSVVAATLRIRTSTQALSAGRVEIARVREGWDEGTQAGGNGVASFSMRQPAVPWTSVGCGPGSRDSGSIGELQPFTADTGYDVALATDAVQAWLLDPASNHGLALVAVGTDNGTVTFFSRESPTPPELVIEVTR